MLNGAQGSCKPGRGSSAAHCTCCTIRRWLGLSGVDAQVIPGGGWTPIAQNHRFSSATSQARLFFLFGGTVWSRFRPHPQTGKESGLRDYHFLNLRAGVNYNAFQLHQEFLVTHTTLAHKLYTHACTYNLPLSHGVFVHTSWQAAMCAHCMSVHVWLVSLSRPPFLHHQSAGEAGREGQRLVCSQEGPREQHHHSGRFHTWDGNEISVVM